MIKIAHLADIHIRNLKYHDVYREVFNQLYEKLKTQEVDYIVVCGDIAHTKTQISPEYVKMASDFFISLAKIAKTVVIPGNHDGLVKNATRLDAISPIIENIKEKNLYFARNSDTISFDDVDFYHLSIFDRENWQTPSDPSKINIALYHGAIHDVKTDVGFVISHGDDNINIFNGFDFALLGDIHKTNQIIDKEGTVRYPGSLISQNFGETNDKGYLLWEIEDSKEFECNHIQLKNPKPFITVSLTPKGRLPRNLSIPANARVRVVSEHHISLDAIKRAIDVVKMKHKPESVSYLNRSSKSKSASDLLDDEYSQKNLRDVGVQEDMIKEFLKDYQLEKDVVQRILSLNKNINSIIEKTDDVARNVYWELELIEYDNLFNYGPGNKIDFENLKGLIGIFGKSFSGKSSIVDALLYTLFNSTSKSVRRNYDMINQNKDYASARAILRMGSDRLCVERKSVKYKKKLHGVVSEEAKTEVEFYKVDIDGKKIADSDVGGESRSETDKEIRNKIGNLEDFLATSFAAQFGSLAFIDQKSTVRKKMLAKFLDLEFFEDKFKEANEQSSDLRGALKMLESTDYVAELENLTEKKAELQLQLIETTNRKEEVTERLNDVKKQVEDIKRFIDSIPEEVEEVSHLEKDLKSKYAEKTKLINSRKDKLAEKLMKREELNNIKTLLNQVNEQDLLDTAQKLEEISEKLVETMDDKIHYDNLADRMEEAKRNIEQAPCNSAYTSCSLVEESYNFLSSLEDSLSIHEKLKDLEKEYKKLEDEKRELASVDAKRQLETIKEIKRQISNLENSEIPLLSARMQHEDARISSLQSDIDSLESKMETYNKNKEKIDLLENKKSDLIVKNKEVLKLTEELKTTTNELNNLFSQKGYLAQKIENLAVARDQLEKMRAEHTAYDLYKKCMHSNGMPFDIIKKRLPVINAEISKILANVVEFEVFFESSDNRLEIYLKHPKHEARLIETGSGAEKTLSATAIRLALLSVSSLPKGDIFILDEPATELDDETKEGFLRILEMIKSYFSKVILISHLDPLKDIVDAEITIEKKNGYAHVQV